MAYGYKIRVERGEAPQEFASWKTRLVDYIKEDKYKLPTLTLYMAATYIAIDAIKNVAEGNGSGLQNDAKTAMGVIPLLYGLKRWGDKRHKKEVVARLEKKYGKEILRYVVQNNTTWMPDHDSRRNKREFEREVMRLFRSGELEEGAKLAPLGLKLGVEKETVSEMIERIRRDFNNENFRRWFKENHGDEEVENIVDYLVKNPRTTDKVLRDVRFNLVKAA